MTPGQQAMFDELSEFAGGARMINAPQLAVFWGRDVRCARAWLQAHKVPKYQMGNGYGYTIRDVSRAMCQSEA